MKISSRCFTFRTENFLGGLQSTKKNLGYPKTKLKMKKYLQHLWTIQIYQDLTKSQKIRNLIQKQRTSKIKSSCKAKELTYRISAGMMVSRTRQSRRDKRFLRFSQMICYKSLENHQIEDKIKMSQDWKLMTVLPQCTSRKTLKSKKINQREGKQDNSCRVVKNVRILHSVMRSNRTVKNLLSNRIKLNILSVCKTTTNKYTHYRQNQNRQEKALTDLRSRIKPLLRDKIQ